MKAVVAFYLAESMLFGSLYAIKAFNERRHKFNVIDIGLGIATGLSWPIVIVYSTVINVLKEGGFVEEHK